MQGQRPRQAGWHPGLVHRRGSYGLSCRSPGPARARVGWMGGCKAVAAHMHAGVPASLSCSGQSCWHLLAARAHRLQILARAAGQLASGKLGLVPAQAPGSAAAAAPQQEEAGLLPVPRLGQDLTALPARAGQVLAPLAAAAADAQGFPKAAGSGVPAASTEWGSTEMASVAGELAEVAAELELAAAGTPQHSAEAIEMQVRCWSELPAGRMAVAEQSVAHLCCLGDS